MGLLVNKTLGVETWKLGGQFTATYTGSSNLASQLQSSGVPLVHGFCRAGDGDAWNDLDVRGVGALWPAAPKIIWLTTLVLILAQLPITRRLSGNVVIGNFLLLLFLASNGAKSVISRIVDVGPVIFYFAAGTVLIHGIIIFGIGRMFRMNGDVLSIASQANVGSTTAPDFASAAIARRSPLLLRSRECIIEHLHELVAIVAEPLVLIELHQLLDDLANRDRCLVLRRNDEISHLR
jgi:hypothetical protein